MLICQQPLSLQKCNLPDSSGRQFHEGRPTSSPSSRHASARSPPSMVATLYVWQYDGGEDGSPEAARRGEQRTYAGRIWLRGRVSGSVSVSVYGISVSGS